ncbi:DUF4184 family protein [Streptomyces sp. NPDC005576]|uniref:DUF4184 family protein n=1 Tax=unclassified Streptomyces TaxID=2593676 RepID=UPI0033C67A29
MPFTLSHAAAVLPLIRRSGTARGPLLASALVAGSFAPDVTYFADSVVPGAMEFGSFTHSAAGVVTVDVLITGALLALWLLLREPLVALLPPSRQPRVYGWVRGRRMKGGLGVREAGAFLLSAVVGSATHVVWDAFTHHDRWGSELLPFLGGSLAGQPVYRLVQYGSSALALIALALFSVSAVSAPALPESALSAPALTESARRRTGSGSGSAPECAASALPELDRRDRRVAGAVLAGGVLLGGVHRCARQYAHSGHSWRPGYPGFIDAALDFVPAACFGAGSGLAAGLVVYATWVRLRGRGRTGTPDLRRRAPTRT